jgi:hypothetical protein
MKYLYYLVLSVIITIICYKNFKNVFPINNLNPFRNRILSSMCGILPIKIINDYTGSIDKNFYKLLPYLIIFSIINFITTYIIDNF